MANPRIIKRYPLAFTLVSGVYYSQPIFVGDYRDIDLTIVGTGTASVLGNADVPTPPNPPNFTAASTITNAYAAVVIADLTIPNTYATTIAVAGSTKLAEVNTNLLTWICVTSTADTLFGYVTVCDNA